MITHTYYANGWNDGEAYASRRIAALQQRFDSLIERVNAASSMAEIAAILNDYEAENAELRKRMGEK